MRRSIPLFAALIAAFVCTTAMAQNASDLQKDKQACETDVYTFCGDAIPDHDRIAACLRKNRNKISRACRTAMDDHRRPHRKKPGG